MELRQLTIFLAVADELHFGRAATRLHLAQSSVSQQLQRLEREIGVSLLTRTSRTVRLTPAGEAFRTQARRLLLDAARAAQIARDAADPRNGTIAIGYNPVAGQSVLPAVVTAIRDRQPGLTVALYELMTGAQLRALETDDLDVGLIYGRPPKPLRSRYILDIPLMAAVSTTHPWAGRARISFAELAGVACVLPSPDSSPAIHAAVTETAAATGVTLHVDDVVDDASATAILARTHDVVAFTTAARTVSAAPLGLVVVPMVAPTTSIAMYAAWQPEPAKPHLVEAFLEYLEQTGPHQWSVRASAPRPAADGSA